MDPAGAAPGDDSGQSMPGTPAGRSKDRKRNGRPKRRRRPDPGAADQQAIALGSPLQP
jgi:hypothetical protein